MSIRIHHECEDGIEKSIPRITDWHHLACQYIVIDFPIHMDTISMGLLNPYFKRSHMDFSELRFTSVLEGCFNLLANSAALRCISSGCLLFTLTVWQSKKEGKDQELVQLSTTPDSGYQSESNKLTIIHSQTRAKRSALSQQVITRHKKQTLTKA